MKFKLCHLREYATQESVKNVFEQEFYMQRLALKRAKKVCNPNIYLRES